MRCILPALLQRVERTRLELKVQARKKRRREYNLRRKLGQQAKSYYATFPNGHIVQVPARGHHSLHFLVAVKNYGEWFAWAWCRKKRRAREIRRVDQRLFPEFQQIAILPVYRETIANPLGKNEGRE